MGSKKVGIEVSTTKIDHHTFEIKIYKNGEVWREYTSRSQSDENGVVELAFERAEQWVKEEAENEQ